MRSGGNEGGEKKGEGVGDGLARGKGGDPIQYSNVGTRSTANTAPSTIVISFNASLGASAA